MISCVLTVSRYLWERNSMAAGVVSAAQRPLERWLLQPEHQTRISEAMRASYMCVLASRSVGFREYMIRVLLTSSIVRE